MAAPGCQQAFYTASRLAERGLTMLCARIGVARPPRGYPTQSVHGGGGGGLDSASDGDSFNTYKYCTGRASNVYGHTTLKTPVLVRSLKLSNVGPGQYLDG